MITLSGLRCKTIIVLELSQMNPNQPECLILRGTCLVGLQDFSAALEDANAVIQVSVQPDFMMATES